MSLKLADGTSSSSRAVSKPADTVNAADLASVIPTNARMHPKDRSDMDMLEPPAAQLLTPHSPSHHNLADYNIHPRSPSRNNNAIVHQALGGSSTQNLLDVTTSRRKGTITKQTSSYSVQLTPPSSSPIGPAQSELEADSPTSAHSDTLHHPAPRTALFGDYDSPKLEPAHIITSSRASSRSFTPRARSSAGSPALSLVASPSHQHRDLPPPLLPAFGDSPVRKDTTPRSLKRPNSIEDGYARSSRSRVIPQITGGPGPEDVVDDVFRLGTDSRRGSAVSSSSFKFVGSDKGEGSSRRTAPGGSEPRPQRFFPAEFLKRPNSVRHPPGSRAFANREPPETPLSHGSAAGISLSPVKGRRIQLVRPASPAVGATGPIEHTSSSAPTGNQKPPLSGPDVGSASTLIPEAGAGTVAFPAITSRLAQHSSPALTVTPVVSAVVQQWLQSSPLTPLHEHPPLSAAEQAEREARKRRRLSAFFDDGDVSSSVTHTASATSALLSNPKTPSRHSSTAPRSMAAAASTPGSRHKNHRKQQQHKSPLKAMLVKGMGRMAINPSDIVEELITPNPLAKKRSPKKRGKKNATPTPRKKITLFGIDVKMDPLKHTNAPLPDVGDCHVSDMDEDDASTVEDESIGELPDWLDDLYPWSESKMPQLSEAGIVDRPTARGKELNPEEKLRLQRLERFFDRVTDDEYSADEEYQVRGGFGGADGHTRGERDISSPGDEHSSATSSPVVSTRPTLTTNGRRSSLLLSANSESPPDARTALIARHSTRPSAGSRTTSMDLTILPFPTFRGPPNSVQAPDQDGESVSFASPEPMVELAAASLEDGDEEAPKVKLEENDEENDDDEGVVNCLCGREHADTPMVRCDSCHTWSHLECVGIDDEEQLGLEWFCYNCEQRMLAERALETEESASAPEPTFTLGTETPRPRVVGAVKFYDAPPLTSSPLFPYSNTGRGLLRIPSTPKNSTFKPSSGFFTPYSKPLGSTFTPRTPLAQTGPLDMRMYSTPRYFPESEPLSSSLAVTSEAFDPNSTPSRGIQLGTPFQDSGTTDRTWTLGDIPTTPTRPLGGLDRPFGSFGGRFRSSSRPLTFYPYPDGVGSPVPQFKSRDETLSAPAPFIPVTTLIPSGGKGKGVAHVVQNESAMRTGNVSEDEEMF